MSKFQGDTAKLAALANAISSSATGDTQHRRLLRMHFPQKDGPARALMLVNTLDATESLSQDFSYRLEVLSDDAKIALTDIMGKMVCVELVREDGTLRYFNGYVFGFRLVKTDGGFAHYEMVLEPWLAHARLRQDNRSFCDERTEDLTEAVLENYLMRDYRVAFSQPDPYLTYSCQHNESDHNFLHRHWEALGWFYRYEHRFDGHRLMLADDSTRLPPIEGRYKHMEFQSQAGSNEDDGVHQWSPARRLMPASVAVASFDFKGPRTSLTTERTGEKHGEVWRFEVYENTGAYSFKTLPDGDVLARRRMEELDAKAQLFDAEGNDRYTEPGRSFTLSGHYRPAAFGEPETQYLIVSVRHQASNNYQHGRYAPSHYSNTFTCIEKRVPWRPGRGFHSVEPKIYGIQTAIVVGPSGAEIYTDKYGRIKVQFHWDRQGKRDSNGLPWVRVLSNWAGSGFGHVSVPRVGMEVAVQFLDGNVDRPLVTGCLYNESHMPPWALPANKTQSGMLSRSSEKGDSRHANAFRFEDQKGGEEIWLHAEKDQRIEVEHDESHWVGNDRKKTVDRDETVEVKHDRKETVGHDEIITIHNNRKERVDQNEDIDIGGNRKETVAKNEHVTIEGMRNELVYLAKDETIGLAKVLSIGGLYQTSVVGAMNTTVLMEQSEDINHGKTVNVGTDSTLTAIDMHKVTVGASTITITPGRIELTADEIIIHGRNKVQIHGDDIDNNPG